MKEIKNKIIGTFCDKCRNPTCICKKTKLIMTDKEKAIKLMNRYWLLMHIDKDTAKECTRIDIQNSIDLLNELLVVIYPPEIPNLKRKIEHLQNQLTELETL